MSPIPPLPLLSPELLRAQHCHEPGDTRFRAAARLQQSLWRQSQGFPCGRFQDAKGRVRRLGSRLTPPVARTGVNLIEPALAPLVRRELAYREIGAVIEPGRFWGNLLASQPLTFSLFGPLKQNLHLATATLRQLAPDLVDTVTDILFEHSPGRGDPRFTEDGTAFDLLIRCTTPGGGRGFVAIELKYSEAPAGVRAPDRPRYTELSRAAGVYRDPDSPALRGGGIEQFWREQLLVTALLQHGLYDAGRLMVITPALNHDCQAALRRYQRQLTDAEPAQYKVRILLKAPFPAALEYIAAQLPIYPHIYYKQVGPQGMGRKPIGTGPYKVESLEPGKEFVLVKNAGYWEGSTRGKPRIGKIRERFIPEKTTQIAELLSGGLDLIWYVPRPCCTDRTDLGSEAGRRRGGVPISG